MASSGKETKPSEATECQKKGGFFSSVGSTLSKVGKEIEKGVDTAATSINRTIDENWKSDLLDNFRTNMKVMLVSRTTFKALQYHNGVLDGLGTLGPDNLGPCTWTVLNDGNNIVRLSVDNNYLAIENKTVVMKHHLDPAQTAPDTRLRLQQTGEWLRLESVSDAKSYVGVNSDGIINPAADTVKGLDAQFGVKVIYSPYPPTVKK